MPVGAHVVADVIAVHAEAEGHVEFRLCVEAVDLRDIFDGLATVGRNGEIIDAVREPEVYTAASIGEDVICAVGRAGRRAQDGNLDAGVRRKTVDVDAPDGRRAVCGRGDDGTDAGVKDGATGDRHGAAGAVPSVPDVGDGVRTGPRLDRAAGDADCAAVAQSTAADSGGAAL